MSLYQEVCVWIVTGAGCVVVVAFAVYFVVVIARLIREIGRSTPLPAPARPLDNTPLCPGHPGNYCGTPLGKIESVDATDEGIFEWRSCARCGQKSRVKQLHPV